MFLTVLLMPGFVCLPGCNKKSCCGIINPPNDTSNIIPPNDPAFASTIGFFGNDWVSKTFTVPAYNLVSPASGTPDASISVDMSNVLTKISKYLFGNNSNLWMGQMVTQPALLGYITDLSPNVLRGPGGSISDMYFWNATSQPPSDAPDSMFDTNGNPVAAGYWFGKNSASWTFSIDNYYQVLQQTHSAGLLTINYAYARYGTGPNPVATAAHLAADWVRYDNGRTKFWEIGNEDNGNWEASYQIDVTKNKDGQPQIITGDLYGQHLKIFADSMRAAAQETGKTIYIGAQLLDGAPASWADATDQNWNQGVLNQAGGTADFFIVHDYFTPYNTNSSAAEILNSALTVPTAAMTYLKQQMAQYNVASKPIALTEWNIFATGSRQMVSNIAGIHAVMGLGELIKNQFGEASRWDLANGWSNGDDQGLFNIGNEPGAALWNPRPAFFHMYYFQQNFGDRMVLSTVTGDPSILSYASSFSSGESGIVIINTGTANKVVALTMKNFKTGSQYYWYTLTGGQDNGDFSGAVFVNGAGPSGATGGPSNYASLKANAASALGGISLTAPPRSVNFVVVANQK
jgi:hypothetical protein